MADISKYGVWRTVRSSVSSRTYTIVLNKVFMHAFIRVEPPVNDTVERRLRTAYRMISSARIAVAEHAWDIVRRNAYNGK